MRSIILSGAFALVLASSAAAMELGNGLSWNNEVTAERNLETETNSFTFETDVAWDFGLGTLEVGPNVFDLENIEWTSTEYQVTMPVKFLDGAEVFTKTSTNSDWEIGDVTIGASFTF